MKLLSMIILFVAQVASASPIEQTSLEIKVGPSANAKYKIAEGEKGDRLTITRDDGTKQVIVYDTTTISQTQQFYVEVKSRKDGKDVVTTLDFLAVMVSKDARGGEVQIFLPTNSSGVVVTPTISPFCKMDIFGESLYITDATKDVPKMFSVVEQTGRLYVGGMIRKTDGGELKLEYCKPLTLNTKSSSKGRGRGR